MFFIRFLNPVLKIETQLIEPIINHNPDISKKEARQRAIDLMKKVDIPSYLVKAGDVVTVKAKSSDFLKTVMSAIDLSCAPAWVTVDAEALKVTFDRVPAREELDPDFKEQLVIEYYSK